MSGYFSGKVVLITGASSGLGEGLALAIARRGGKVGLMARREEALKALASRIEGEGGRAAWRPCDVRDRGSVEEAIADLQGRLGPCDVLIANAGVGLFTPGWAFRTDAAEQVVQVNLLGAIYAIGAVLPAMVERGSGHLAGVSSLAAYRALPRFGVYAASKAALSTLLESLRMDLAGRGIHVTAIHPGFVRTEMTANNRFKMPFLLERDDAVEVMVRGLERRAARVDFPWPLDLAMRVARLVPGPLWTRLGGAGRRLPEP